MLLSITCGWKERQLGNTFASLWQRAASSSQAGVTIGRQLERADTTCVCVCVCEGVKLVRAFCYLISDVKSMYAIVRGGVCECGKCWGRASERSIPSQ